jgi:hypothetical protein
VRHHARQFGKSKYGLSRIYKVLLDLMVIKTVASFTARPLLWFCMLALPLLAIGLFAIGWSLVSWAEASGPLPLPVAGSGVILVFGALMMISSGVLGELIYKLGDLREQQFSRLTQSTWGRGRG